MSLDLRQIARLQEVLEASFQAEQARLSEVSRRIEAVQGQLAALHRTRDVEAESDLSPAAIAKADMRWRAWVEQRRRSLNNELARLMTEREARRADLATAFGKRQAAEGMLAQLTEEARRKSRRQT